MKKLFIVGSLLMSFITSANECHVNIKSEYRDRSNDPVLNNYVATALENKGYTVSYFKSYEDLAEGDNVITVSSGKHNPMFAQGESVLSQIKETVVRAGLVRITIDVNEVQEDILRYTKFKTPNMTKTRSIVSQKIGNSLPDCE